MSLPYGLHGSTLGAMSAAHKPQWLAPVGMTFAAWVVAFGVVTALLTVFRDQLGGLPLALRALVISGVLAAVMVNLVMPRLNVAVGRWVRGAREHPRLATLPEWPTRTIGVLSTVEEGPYAIPVSAPQRAGDRRQAAPDTQRFGPRSSWHLGPVQRVPEAGQPCAGIGHWRSQRKLARVHPRDGRGCGTVPDCRRAGRTPPRPRCRL